ncbi:amino acid ABC transporter permease [Limimaricola pyoseonensis]|uniref:Amino acid ABC transporter membrane protein 1, PAAT family n=1 Tax=Limimaricola pyoseonensis TaxID=521013 RepID=A0A1G7HRG7_9RHOB|nr:amino acid ABC transporter permease [Limimaricola pyoseonensis]SDF02908.1 amino acid ABC transporter membrane protein 1, PAAT family [Limimaricola pyoseonensis]
MIRSWNALEPHLGFLLEGFALTVAACVLAVAGAVVLGALIASLRTARSRAARAVAAVYCDLFRNVPFIVQLFFFFYGLPELGIYIGAFETGVLAMSIAGGAFVADVIRAGILSIEQGVIEAARVFGLGRWQIFSRIVMPNALRVSVRPMGSVLINLVLTSSILSTITVNELTGTAKIVAATTFMPFEVYAVLLVLYAALTYALSLAVAGVHRRLNRGMPEAVA